MAQETLQQALDGTVIASPFQSDKILPDPDTVLYRSDHIQTTDAWGMPADLPLPIAESNGVLLPATAQVSPLADYSPWTAIEVLSYDHSRPRTDAYGEAVTCRVGSIVAEWGGMPSPARDYQDQTMAVAALVRNAPQHSSSGPTGRFYGAQQTAWEAQAGIPAPDYWSTLTGGGG